MDIGGTKIAVGVGDRAGAIRARRRRPTEATGSPAGDLARIADDVRAALAESGLTIADVAGVGVTAPGPLDPERGVVLLPPNLPGWRDVPISAVLHDALGVPVFLENDANAAALAEWHFGAGRGFRHLVFLTMSTGIGGGLILDGRIYRGVLGSAGEIGHVPVEWEGEPCSCGQRGCLEAYTGGASWTRRLRARAPEDGRVAQLAGGREHVTPVQLVQAAREGDGYARAELARWCDYVARGITAVVMALAPEVVVLGTIAVAAGEELAFAPIREQVASHVWPHLARELRIVPAALGKDLPYLAGLSVAVEALGAPGG
ncbi:MAG: ROK family protein [Deltaproteobacteria bacterium]|nr:ROK family protein [Deltaproteobacteria bacterium]